MSRLIHIENKLKKCFEGDIKVKKCKNDYITLDITNAFTTFHDAFPIDWDENTLIESMVESYFNYIFSKFFTKKACNLLKSLL